MNPRKERERERRSKLTNLLFAFFFYTGRFSQCTRRVSMSWFDQCLANHTILTHSLFFPYSFLSFFLCRYGCISMHKRQKLYKWCSVPHHQLYTSAVRRCIQGGKSCKPIRQPALQLFAGEISIEVSFLLLFFLFYSFR